MGCGHAFSDVWGHFRSMLFLYSPILNTGWGPLGSPPDFLVMSPQDTFARAKNWVKELQRQASPNIVIALAGNKADLASKRAVEFQVGSPPSPPPAVAPTRGLWEAMGGGSRELSCTEHGTSMGLRRTVCRPCLPSGALACECVYF